VRKKDVFKTTLMQKVRRFPYTIAANDIAVIFKKNDEIMATVVFHKGRHSR
jgi:hypothetical protein